MQQLSFFFFYLENNKVAALGFFTCWDSVKLAMLLAIMHEDITAQASISHVPMGAFPLGAWGWF